MRISRVVRPKNPRNVKLTAAACLAVLLVYAVGARFTAWSPKRGLGLAFGFLAAAIFVFAMAYPARRPRARPLGTAQAWIQAHICLGVIALVAAYAHAGFTWPHGVMGWSLTVLATWTALSGLVGVWLQKWIPATLAEGLKVEAVFERIPELVKKVAEEADALMEGASDVLERSYLTEVHGNIKELSPSWSYLFDVRASRERSLEPFRRIERFVEDTERDRVLSLANLYTEKIELDAQYRMQSVLRTWLWLHVPPAGALIGLLVIHVLTWAWY